jgi:hypothetical protein
MSTEYYATDVYTGGGDTFTVSFERASDNLVKVDVNDIVLTRDIDYTLLNDVVTLVVPAEVGEVVTIYRETPIENVLDWNIAKFTSSNLQTEEEHLTNIQQELYDLSTRILRTTLI